MTPQECAKKWAAAEINISNINETCEEFGERAWIAGYDAALAARPAPADDAPVEVHLNTRSCEPMKPETAEALAAMFKAAHEQLSRAAAADDAEPWCTLTNATAAKVVSALVEYRKAQRRMLERWADGDEAVKKELWRALHDCEPAANAALEAITAAHPAAADAETVRKAVEMCIAAGFLSREKFDEAMAYMNLHG